MAPVFREELLDRYEDSEVVLQIVSSPSCASSSRLEDSPKASAVASELGIRVPLARRVVQNDKSAYTILVSWKELGWFTTVKHALQLRRFVKLLRSVTSPTAGSLATGECRSFWLEDRCGLPANSGPGEITHFFHFWANFTSIRRAMQESKQPRVPDSPKPTTEVQFTVEPFVLTHHDLTPRNLLISPSGQLTVLDWDLAGFYPIPIEYTSIYNFNIPADWGLLARWRWHLFAWIGVGYYEADARLLWTMRSKFTRFTIGRRYELLAHGGPSRYPVT
ncbi:hypothetical protein BJX68DRAFT_259008 [Aspergillus pseudodeflectus]|uniref:Aminoglycoside phosphotransferase domain-containing protein n=1 Tax=Aspergillus pseudodeflectus TaxID=176178 RepID=A0ABR4JG62_9EURO